MTDPITQITQLFAKFGTKTYGEACDQTTHAISCAMHAQSENADDNTVVAALLHDIGHFIADQEQRPGFDQWGHKDHAQIGSNWLKNLGFPTSVYEPIRYHVDAKRYLYTKRTSASLSKASSTTLQQQGGLMTQQQMLQFEQSRFFTQAICLRRYDDMGKPETSLRQDLTPWLALVKRILKG